MSLKGRTFFGSGFKLIVFLFLILVLPLSLGSIDDITTYYNRATGGSCTSGRTGTCGRCPDGSTCYKERDADCTVSTSCDGGGSGRGGNTGKPGANNPKDKTPTTPPKSGGKCTAGRIGTCGRCPDGSACYRERDTDCTVSTSCDGGGSSKDPKTNPGDKNNPTTPPVAAKCTAGRLGTCGRCPDGSACYRERDTDCTVTTSCDGGSSDGSSNNGGVKNGYTGAPAPSIPMAGSGCSGGYASGATAIGPGSGTYQCRNGRWEQCPLCALNIVPEYVKQSPELTNKYILEPLKKQQMINEYLTLSDKELASKYCGTDKSCLATFKPEMYINGIPELTSADLSYLAAARKPSPTSKPIAKTTPIFTPKPSYSYKPTPFTNPSPSPKPTTTTTPKPTTTTTIPVASPTGYGPGLLSPPTPGKTCTPGVLGTGRCPDGSTFYKYRNSDCSVESFGCAESGAMPRVQLPGGTQFNFYWQNVGSYANKPVNGGSFSTWGCGPTSVSMLLCTYTDNCTDPYATYQKYFPTMQSSAPGSYCPNCGLSLTELLTPLRQNGFTDQPVLPTASDIANFTNANIPVLAHVTLPGNIQHLTVITGVTSDGHVIAQDPYKGMNYDLTANGVKINSAYATYPGQK